MPTCTVASGRRPWPSLPPGESLPAWVMASSPVLPRQSGFRLPLGADSTTVATVLIVDRLSLPTPDFLFTGDKTLAQCFAIFALIHQIVTRYGYA